MNGPEHYREAERLLDLCVSDVTEDGDHETLPGVYLTDPQLTARALVHAQLALAAATAEAAPSSACRTTWQLVLQPTQEPTP